MIVEPASAGSAEYLGEIVVEESQPVVSRMSNRFEINRELVERRGDTSLEQTLELIPNLTVRHGGQGVPRIDIRGLRTRHIKFLVNGVPYNSTFDGQFDPSFITATQVDKLKVITSGVSELYGAGAFGVIDVLTKLQHQPHLKLNAEVGEGEQKQLSAQMGGAGDGHSYYLNLTHRSRDYYDVADDFDATSEENGGQRLNSDRERNTGFASVSFTLSPDLKVGLNGSFLTGDYGIPPTILKDDFASKPSYRRIENQRGYALQGSFNYTPDADYFLRGWLYRNELNQDENRYDDANFNSIADESLQGSYLSDINTDITGLGLQAGYQFNTQSRLTLALETHQDKWDQDGIVRDVSLSGGGGGSGGGKGKGGGGGKNSVTRYGLRDLNQEGEIDAYSMAAEFEADLTDRLSLVAGAGLHRQNPDTMSSDSDHSFLFGVDYRFSSRMSLSTSIARKIRMPSIRNLYDVERGNPDLEPEVLEGLTARLSYQFPAYQTEMQLALFRNDIEDFIQRNRATELFENIEKSKIEGIELSLKTQPVEPLDLRLGYSYQRSEDLTDSGRDELTNTPGQILSLDAGYRLTKRFYLHGSYRYVADQYYYSRNQPLQKARLRDIARLDLRISWQPVQKLSAYIGVKNMLDKDFADEYALPSPGRSLVVGINWQQ